MCVSLAHNICEHEGNIISTLGTLRGVPLSGFSGIYIAWCGANYDTLSELFMVWLDNDVARPFRKPTWRTEIYLIDGSSS